MATNTPLQSILLTSSTSTIVFSNIDQNYTDLVLVVSAKVDTGLDIWLRCNGDSGSNYGYVTFTGNGTTPTSSRTSNVTEGLLADWDGVPKPTFGHILTFTLNNYSNTTTYKTSLARSNRGDSGVDIITSTWRNTNAITNLTLRASNGSRTFDAGTTVDLYGIKSGAPKASGGNTLTTDGNYWYHTFRSSGTFLLQQPTSVDYLVVAGGGGGGGWLGGGGGAGGLRSTVTATGGGGSLESALSMAPGSYTVTVGAGGAGGNYGNPAEGTVGSNSVFSTITSAGGGYGGAGGNYTSTVGGNGGSGGGGGGATNTRAGGNGTANQGFNGGNCLPADYAAAGGGGAGAVGGNTPGTGNGVNTGTGGAGGAGVAVSISGSSVTYAGGGGGHGQNAGGAGGTGGGGAGNVASNSGFAATANTGGGGGGGRDNTGGAGGSGIVIVRYAV